MKDPWDLVDEINREFDVEIDDYPLDILCYHDSCWRSECDCWYDLEVSLRNEAKNILKKKNGTN